MIVGKNDRLNLTNRKDKYNQISVAQWGNAPKMQRLFVFCTNLHKRFLDLFRGMYYLGRRGLDCKAESVFNGRFMAFNDATFAIKAHSSYGFHFLNHLTADGTCLLRGKVAVVTLLKIYAYFSWCSIGY